MCRNIPGDYRCGCNDGFYDTKSGNSTKAPNCIDIDECALVNVNYCFKTEQCINTDGSYYCKCITGCDNTTAPATTTTTTTATTTVTTTKSPTTLSTGSTLGFTASITNVIILTPTSTKSLTETNTKLSVDQSYLNSVLSKVNIISKIKIILVYLLTF